MVSWRHGLATALGVACVAAAAQNPPELVGRYQLAGPGGDILELRKNGSANLAGDELRWSAQGNQLRVGTDTMPYVLLPDRLVLNFGGAVVPWMKLGAAKAAAPSTLPPAAAQAPAAPAPNPGGNPQDAQARQLLTQTAWCSFTYNKVSGTSTTRKVVFRPDGLMLVQGGAETYSSGAGGTYAGQSSNGATLRWRLDNLRLFVDLGQGMGFQDVGLNATRNSSGAIILHADGREYSMCR